jgi:type VI secretion system protein ImpF
VQDIRAAVMRDLAWLVNTTSLSTIEDLESYPEVGSSVLNFGIPELTGLTSHAIDTSVLARIIKQAILNFEPRFLPRTLRVRVEANPSEMSGNTLIFHIEGQIWAKPSPLALHLRTEVDLESNSAVIVEASR